MGYPALAACVLKQGLIIPYWDRVTATTLTWTPTPGVAAAACTVSFDNSVNDFWSWTALYSWLNKANPDWVELYDPSSAQTFANIAKFQFFALSISATLAVCTVNTPVQQPVDFWWGTNAFAKYGFFVWGGNYPLGKTKWINYLYCAFVSNTTQYYGFSAGPAPMQTINVTVYSRLALAQISTGGALFPYPT